MNFKDVVVVDINKALVDSVIELLNEDLKPWSFKDEVAFNLSSNECTEVSKNTKYSYDVIKKHLGAGYEFK